MPDGRDLRQYQRLAIQPQQIQDQQVQLTPGQRHYLERVLRLRTGDSFIAMDGQGHWWLAQLTGPSRAQIGEPLPVDCELPAPVALLMGIPKGDGIEQVIRQTTELGVRQIIPLLTERTQVHPSPARHQRWQRIATEAAEQSWRQWIPRIAPAQSLADAWSQVATMRCLVCALDTNAPHLRDVLGPEPEPLALCIGPEGGWSDTEMAWFRAQGATLVSLGRRVLRSVTAPVVALALVAASWER
ncbi:MAG: 16S rRNA (uracil(1498)-N(3))-methyltransferase [Gloeomargarita sp. SKYBB_i_bin120]|nr:16S rRNA (uracil(1498)-N(3))-methyltransferase [Gloeomargarita sp. SKYB120]MDW8178819.1 16S rRNA (uracil(1498)-N(3))-methyltransferase [Gloeomargarita sp. SKYBB_i_bin120]